MYQNQKAEYIEIANDVLSHSIDNKLLVRSGLFGTPQNHSRPKLTIKSMDEMTPEEIKSHEGDTIILTTDSQKDMEIGISTIFAQNAQDALLEEQPFPMNLLDSIIKNELQKKLPYSAFLLNLCDKKGNILDSNYSSYNHKHHTITAVHTIGTKGEFYIKAFIEIQPQKILQQMLYALIISFLMTIIIFYCLYYQLIVIRRTRKKLQQQEQTVHVAIHDLKAPLNTTYTILDYISQKETDNTQKSLLQTGKIQVRKLTETIESMLDAHKKKQNIEIKNVQVCLPELIEQVRQEVALLFPAKKYQFKLNNPIPIHYIYTDPIRLERSLRNLLENALKYSDDGVQITVMLSQKDNRFSIAIQDTGWGIPLKAQKKLGKEYYRVRTEGKDVRTGYGLGLCSVKQLLQEAGGTLTLHSSEGAGSVFTITFPVSEGE